MAEKKLNPILKLVLELGPIILFFVAYRWAPVPEGAVAEDAELAKILFATALFIPTILAALAASWILSRHLPRMAVITAILVVVFGGLTLWLRDGTFIKMKPTVLYLAFAGILGYGLLRGQSYLRYLMEEMLPMQEEGWMIFTRRFVWFFLALAVANELAWRVGGTDVWVNFKTFGLPLANFVFILAQMSLFQKFAPEESPSSD
ncbi:septation protein A [Oceanomicrobium pacificus]|uniref:Inner membrane-spanning protein YciB n=1 Tax=Oceanomicrobium pacificus TaxID=2692916 RepID=A0A6B0TVH0_9RHOB|nr:septation protein A [Oceanomicrobium pacificus]MXU65548.1 septation protein A [Oceanomicrobium pacificus]